MSNPSAHWPFFDLVIQTPRLTLRYPDDHRAAALMDLAASAGVHDPGYMPFSVPWTRFEPPYLQRQGMQHYWRMRAELQPESWDIPFAVYDGDELVGIQALGAKAFAVTGTVGTGSWLAKPVQGKGIGKEMRAAVLHLAFEGLGAERAVTSAFADNTRSIGVTTSLGYQDNGWEVDDREGTAVRHLRYVLERAAWVMRRRDDITFAGLDPCMPVLGIASPRAD
ncbi:MAG: GCN5-related protein N-acetyltransferase [Frankiales bacterium]|nr:GCN5-related protein N-acetyltransferase [Frankiales bacterium]